MADPAEGNEFRAHYPGGSDRYHDERAAGDGDRGRHRPIWTEDVVPAHWEARERRAVDRAAAHPTLAQVHPLNNVYS
jgi:hypothetical protein